RGPPPVTNSMRRVFDGGDCCAIVMRGCAAANAIAWPTRIVNCRLVESLMVARPCRVLILATCMTLGVFPIGRNAVRNLSGISVQRHRSAGPDLLRGSQWARYPFGETSVRGNLGS